MSTPARKVAARPSPARKATRPSPRPRPAMKPKAPEPAPSARRSRSALAFVVFTATVMALMILGLVALNAVLAQSSFRIDDLQSRVEDLSRTYGERRLAVARLSSPARIAKAARKIGMTLPEGGIQVLHVPEEHPGGEALRDEPRGGGGAPGARVVGGRP